ncbi:MAG TPA: hypothetical protein VMV33_14220 [Rhodocyclaceae bacterium]|nr:hypothetical protein [Rhodocyclaceae bacterium]
MVRAYVENGSKFTRGKTRIKKEIDDLVTASFKGTKKLNDTEYRVPIHYETDADLKAQLDVLLQEIYHIADLRNCVVDDVSIKNEATKQYWRDYEGRWES